LAGVKEEDGKEVLSLLPIIGEKKKEGGGRKMGPFLFSCRDNQKKDAKEIKGGRGRANPRKKTGEEGGERVFFYLSGG